MNNQEQGVSFEAACQWHKKVNGKDYSALPIVDHLPVDMQKPVVSQYKLWVIAAALRENKKLKRGYYPWFWIDRAGSGSRFSCNAYDYAIVISFVGARLEYPDRETAEYAAKQHEELYKDVFVIPED